MSGPRIESIYPLSSQQAGMLFETLTDPSSSVHVEQKLFFLHEDLDVDRYREAWRRVLERHASLRATFVWRTQREPRQVILSAVDIPIEEHDLRPLSSSAQKDALATLLQAERRRGFELSKAPLMRLALLRLGDRSWAGLWTHHHLLLDGWSIPIVSHEVRTFYAALRAGRDVELPAARPYRDYLRWLAGRDWGAAESFWRAALDGIRRPTPLGVLSEIADDGLAPSGYGYCERRFPAGFLAALKRLALAEHLTINTLLQGAWAIALSRYSGEEQIVFGTTVSGRPPELPGVESMVGLFINTLPFRLSVTSEALVSSWLAEIQRRHLELRQYEYCSTGQIHQWSQLPGGLALYDSVVVFENYPDDRGPDTPDPGPELEGQFDGARTGFTLTILASVDPELTLRAVFDTRVLYSDHVARVIEHLRIVLEAVVSDPGCTVGRLRRGIPEREIPVVRSGGRLPAPGAEGTSLQTTTEQLLAGIWASLLGTGSPRGDENFFESGGHSLLATQLVSRLREKFGIEVPLARCFEAPTLRGLARVVDEMLLKGHGEQRADEPGARSGALKDIPLSFAQERMWFLHQLDRDSPLYNVPLTIWLPDAVNPAVLERAIDAIVRRHEVLRTRFQFRDQRPVQIIEAERRIPLSVRDFSGLDPSTRLSEVERFVGDEVQRPFDLAEGPLVRTTLLRLDLETQVLLFVTHHIVADGWSVEILQRELATLYAAFAAGKEDPLEPLPIQYADFAVWQRRWLQPEKLRQELEYWKAQLDGAPAVLELPTDRPRPVRQGTSGASQSLLLTAELTERLKTASARQGATLFMTLLAAFKILLHRLSGEADIVIGTPIAGRSRKNTETLIGCFLNTLALRTQVSGDFTFETLLARVREVALGAYAHQNVPFERLLEEISPVRATASTPVFQIFFNMLNYAEPGLDAAWRPHVDDDDGHPREALARFDLTLYVEERADRLHLKAVYRTDLFDHARLTELLQQFQALLDQIVSSPERRISDYSLVTSAARKVLPDPRAAFQADRSPRLEELLRQAARGDPERLALAERDTSWSYRDLDALSDRVAALLRTGGIQARDRVAIVASRGVGLVAALLGVIKAKAAFVILDPAYPISYLASCLRLARPRVWIDDHTTGPIVDALAASWEGPLRRFTVERATVRIVSQPQSPVALVTPPNMLDPERDLAYLSFTSGTTGVPRAILGSQAPLAHFFQWHVRTFGLSADDRFSMLSGLSHDPLLRDTLTPLSLGAMLCIPSRDDLESPNRLAAWVRRERITVMHLTPAMGKLLLLESATSASADPCFPALRYLFFGGDVLQADLQSLIHERAPDARVVSFYGTTETPQAMAWCIADEPEDRRLRRATVPLGHGIDAAQLILQSKAGVRAGVGELAEIFVRSPFLAHGYLDPDLTARSFCVNPFTGQSGDRMFRTGDMGRYLPDGRAEFVGRVDQQVKIRGFRVDAGDVEAILEQNPTVRRAAVALANGTPGHEARLIAYVVPRSGHSFQVSDLRQFARERLPAYMVPSFVMVTHVPLTPNGKLDRAALPGAAEVTAEVPGPYIAPTSDTQRALAKIWVELLGVERVGIHDDFFELGGHSLLAFHLISRVLVALGVEIPVRAVFDAPTLAGLEQAVIDARTTGQPASEPIERISREKHRFQPAAAIATQPDGR